MLRHLPLICLALVFGVIAIAPLAMAVTSAPSSGQVAVVFNPGLGHSALALRLAEADVSLVRFGALPGSAVVDLRGHTLANLTEAGAWIIADPIILGGCQPETSSQSPTRGVSI